MKYDGEDYLKQYPKLRKWMNTCVCCGRIGHKPELPKALTSSGSGGEFITAAAGNLRAYFSPLEVNEYGLCEICSGLQGDKNRI